MVDAETQLSATTRDHLRELAALRKSAGLPELPILALAEMLLRASRERGASAGGGLMRVLGVDPGSVKMGYGLIGVAPGCRLTFVAAGVLTAPAGHGKYLRLMELGLDLEEVIAEYRPDVCALEAGFVKGQMGALVSGAARGVAAYVAGCAGLPVVEYAPKTVKKAACGNGAADKDQVARVVTMILGLKVQPVPDAADALAIAICRAHDRDAGWVERPRAATG